MKYRFVPGDAAELRRWSASIRAAVQRLAQASRTDSEFHAIGEGPAVVTIGGDAQELAAAGLRVVALSDVDRSREADLLLEGRSPLANAVDEALAAVRWFKRHGAESVALYGKGDGGAVALHAAILLGDNAPVAIEGYHDLRALGLPGTLRYADLPDLYAALAPRPLWTDFADQTLVDAYKAFEASDRLESGTSLVEFLKRPVAASFSIPPLRVYFDTPARIEVSDRIDQVLSSGMLTQGKLVVEFEELAKRFTGGDPVAVSTGTAALDIAYQLLNVAGKTVLAPVNTFFATAASVERMGGKVDFVDVELEGFGMDPHALREALERHDSAGDPVAAVVVVHIGGVVAPSFKDILAECTARGIPVVEDTAHALGATLDGQLAGTMGVMGTYSLHPAKVATSGEGGFFIAQDPAHTDAARKLRDHGKISIDKNIHDRLGNNWRLSEVHAAVGLAHFGQLDEMLRMRRELAAWYDEHIDGVPRVTRFEIPAGAQSNYYKYIAFLDPAVDRAELKARLRQRHGVSLAGEVYDVLLSDQPYFAQRFAGRSFANASWFTRHHICLPAFPSMTTAEQRHVLSALRSELS
jgi:dTDP-4-amino-4,6-dideoxygalactose transaminase